VTSVFVPILAKKSKNPGKATTGLRLPERLLSTLTCQGGHNG
jgi:hypothetical protein